MNRRQAIAALTALPAVSRVTVAQSKPDDVVVVECDEHVPDGRLLQLKERIEQVFPNRKVLVLGPSIRLKLVQG